MIGVRAHHNARTDFHYQEIDVIAQVNQWDYFELPLQGPASGKPFIDVSLTADFSCGNLKIRVDGFYDGEGIYKVRFMPPVEGVWDFITHSNQSILDSKLGQLLCVPPTADNHGPVRVANQYHFAYADGTPYHPVGTTCYVWNLQGDEMEEQTLKTLDQAPFNKMRMCVFPKRYTFNSNEPPVYPFPAKFSGTLKQPWSPEMVRAYFHQQPPDYWDFDYFNPAYFQHLERCILDLLARGIEADLILFHPYDYGAWGFDRMPAEINDRYLRYIVARLAAFRNVWWSFANEYDLFIGRTMEDWDHYMQYVQQLDPYNHLRSIHNCQSFYDHTKPWVTHCSIQSWNMYRVPAWREKYHKPVVIDECGYEGDINMLWGDLSPERLTHRFWTGFTHGGYVGHGETYVNEREELWWSKGGRLSGSSVARIAFLRKIFEAAPNLTPVEKVDGELNNLMEVRNLDMFFGSSGQAIDTIIPEGRWNCTAGGYCEDKYFMFYFGSHQPSFRNFNLPEGSYRVDVIDTWNMTIDCFSECAVGAITIPMPARKYMAIRIQKNL
ncbi:MAG: DUF5605 domain-containing protein [Anaerolineaceae bacterium]